MTDLFLQAAQTTTHHIAPHVKPLIYHITQPGVSYMTAIISSAVAFLVGGGLGWYFGPKAAAAVTTEVAAVQSKVQADVAKATSAL